MFGPTTSKIVEFLTNQGLRKAEVGLMSEAPLSRTLAVESDFAEFGELDMGKLHNDDVDSVDLSFFKILIAESYLNTQSLFAKILQDLKLQFTMVQNGQEAIEALREGYYDLVFLDCHMKEMNGFETTQAIRNSSERFAKIPVVGFAKELSAEASDQALKSGMNDLLVKPSSFEDMQPKVQEWLRRVYSGLPVLDVSALEKIRIFDDEHQSLLRSLFQIYSENTQEEIFKLRDLVQNGSLDLARKKAHMLKSSAAQLGAHRFEKFCILMEHQEDLDMAKAQKLYQQMANEYEKSRHRFSEYCQSLGQNPNALI